MFPEERGISGKKLVPIMFIGFLLFTIFGLLGTYGLGKLVAPWLRKGDTEIKREMKQQEATGKY